MYNGKLSQKVGIVFFIDDNLTSAWACRGGQNSFYISSVTELDRNTFWISNVPLEIAVQTSEAYDITISPRNYASVYMDEIILELGLNGLPKNKLVSVLANVLSSASEFYALYTGQSRLPAPFLASGVRVHSGTNPVPQSRSVESLFSRGSTPPCHVAASLKNTVSLTFHRFEYAIRMLQGLVPAGKWNDVSQLATSMPVKRFNAWLEKLSKPVLVCASIESDDNNNLHEHFYSSYAWMSAEEFVFLSKCHSLSVRSVMIADATGLNTLSVPNWGSLPKNSYAFGIFCQNLWASLLTEDDSNLTGLWFDCKNRFLCYQKALDIYQKNRLDVIGFSLGKLYLRDEAGVSGFSADLAVRHELISNMILNAPESRRRELNKATPTELLQIAMERGALGFIQETDFSSVVKVIDILESETQSIYQRPKNRFLI